MLFADRTLKAVSSILVKLRRVIVGVSGTEGEGVGLVAPNAHQAGVSYPSEAVGPLSALRYECHVRARVLCLLLLECRSGFSGRNRPRETIVSYSGLRNPPYGYRCEETRGTTDKRGGLWFCLRNHRRLDSACARNLL